MEGKVEDGFDEFMRDPESDDLMDSAEILGDGDSMKIERMDFKRDETTIGREERFIIHKKPEKFGCKYSSICIERLGELRMAIIDSIQDRWPDEVISNSINSCSKGELTVIIGSLYKEMPLVPRILEEYIRNDIKLSAESRLHSYVSSNDILFLEDEHCRVKLVSSNTPDQLSFDSLVSGIVLAVLGELREDGCFLVHDLCFPPLPPQPSFPERLLREPPRYLAFVSGLQVGSDILDMLSLQMMVDFLTGHSGSSDEQLFASKIVKLIVCGNSLTALEDTPVGSALNDPSAPFKALQQNLLVQPLKDLDGIMAQLAASMPLDLMPGESDPSNYLLPQQPFKKCLFPQAAAFSTLRVVTNPFETSVDGTVILGNSGQPLSIMNRFKEQTDPLLLLEDSLRWRHMSPVVPLEEGCYPFEETDPFIINTCPHIYFAGCQEEFATKLVTGKDGQTTRLLVIPQFCKSRVIVLVELSSLKVIPFSFQSFPSQL